MFRRTFRKTAVSVGIVLACTFAAPSPFSGSIANAHADEASLIKDLKDATDFRVRTSAALSLGRSKSKAAKDPLIGALSDSNSAVRAAAAAALEALGDRSAVTGLKRARVSEKDSDVRAQIDEAIGKLDGGSAARFLVSIGKLQNKSDLKSSAVSEAFKKAAHSKLSSVSGIELLADGADLEAEAKKRNLPGVVLDGNLTKLSKSTSGSDVGYAAHVEFMVRKVPDQSLKGSVTGDAKALANKSGVGDAELSQLQVDAVTEATASALKGAPTAIEAAAK